MTAYLCGVREGGGVADTTYHTNSRIETSAVNVTIQMSRRYATTVWHSRKSRFDRQVRCSPGIVYKCRGTARGTLLVFPR